MLDPLALSSAQPILGPTDDAFRSDIHHTRGKAVPNLRAFAVRLTGPTVSPSIFGTVALQEREKTPNRVGRARDA